MAGEIQILRTVTRTRAPILRRFTRIVAHRACSRSVPFRPSLRSAWISTYATVDGLGRFALIVAVLVRSANSPGCFSLIRLSTSSRAQHSCSYNVRTSMPAFGIDVST